MNLIVDCGNTSIKLAFFEGKEIIQLIILPKQDINQVFIALEDKRFENSILCSVIDNRKSEIIDIIRYRSKFFIYFNPKTPIPIKNQYKTPETLGNDRLALAAGMCFKYPNHPGLVIDIGTCITYDFVNERKEYKGGSISPGIQMRYKALNAYTDQLPLLEMKMTHQLYGQDTADSIHTGVIQGVKNEILTTIAHYRAKYPRLKVVITGGDVNYLFKRIKSPIFASRDFLLSSLNLILLHNV